MAKKTKQTKPAFDQDVPVTFGAVGCNGDSMRVGLKVSRADMTLEDVDGIFCDNQLDLCLMCDPNAERGDQHQQPLLDGNTLDVAVTAISKSFSTYNDHFACSLSIPAGGHPDLLKFSKRQGKILVTVVGSAADKPDDDGDPKAFPPA